MKKRIIAAVLCATLALSMSACGKAKTSGSYKLNVDELVVSVCDYDDLSIGLSSEYTITQDDIDATMETMAAMCTSYTEITDRTTVEDGDYVLADYTGYRDGVAFDGGAATNQYLYIADNNGYIDGFTDGLPGMEVGETATFDVTFPDPYPNNTDLSGVTVQFEFTIHGIYAAETATLETMTDDQVLANFYSYYGVTTVSELNDYIANYMNSYNDYYRDQEILENTKKYMIENSEINVPDEYLELRMNEYIASFTENYVDTANGQTLEEYLEENYQTSYEDAYAEWTEYMTEVIKTELLFERIAEMEGLTIDEDEFQNYVTELQTNYSLESASALYEKFGNGNAEEGETYIRRMYLINKAIDLVLENVTTYYDESLAAEADE